MLVSSQITWNVLSVSVKEKYKIYLYTHAARLAFFTRRTSSTKCWP